MYLKNAISTDYDAMQIYSSFILRGGVGMKVCFIVNKDEITPPSGTKMISK